MPAKRTSKKTSHPSTSRPRSNKPRKPHPNQFVKCSKYLSNGNFCNKTFKYRDGVPTDTGKIVCPSCASSELKKTSELDELLWYVMQVEPGQDVYARKDLLKRAKAQTCTDIKRVLIPRRFHEGMYTPGGELVHQGSDVSFKDALNAGVQYAENITEDRYGVEEENAWRDYFKLSVFFNEKTGTYQWILKTKEKEVRKVVKVKKYPGYVFVQCRFTPTVADIIKKTKYSWGLLLNKVVESKFLTKITASKRGGYLWKVTESSTKKLIDKGKELTEVLASAKAKDVIEKASEFKPVAMKTQEAAEELLAQKALNQISKDKDELYKVHVQLKPGDKVRIKDPLWKGAQGEILSINKKDKTNPKAIVAIVVLGTIIRTEVNVIDCVSV